MNQQEAPTKERLVKQRPIKRSYLIAGLALSAFVLPGCVRSMESYVAHRYEHLLPQVERVNADVEDAFGLARVPDVSLSVAAEPTSEPTHSLGGQ